MLFERDALADVILARLQNFFLATSAASAESNLSALLLSTLNLHARKAYLNSFLYDTISS